jgi:hypothetical protein
MGTISPYLSDAVFQPADVQAMSTALDEVCEALECHRNVKAKEIIATRIIELAGRGVRSPTALRDRLLKEATGKDSVAASRL